MIVLGIDPGLDGAATILGPQPTILDLPTKRDEETGRRIDGVELARQLRLHLNGAMDIHVCIEAMANGGRDRGNFASVGSQFWTQSAIVTTLELLGLSVQTFVHPSTWKRLYDVGGKRELDASVTKRRVRELVAQLYPQLADFVQRQADHNRAESALIAHWYRKVRG